MKKKSDKKLRSQGDSENLEALKKLVLISMFADDELMNRLVLKGGNALDLVYKIGYRGSMDFDFSIAGEFSHDELSSIKDRLERALNKIFNEQDYGVFDVVFREVSDDPQVPSFWGGYILEFKLIPMSGSAWSSGDLNIMRREAVDAGPGSVKKFRVEISKREACEGKIKEMIDNYVIYVYTPAMIVCEKLRAICQQMPEYCLLIGKSHSSPRARDFFDIVTAVKHFGLDLTADPNLKLLKSVFGAKQVPLSLIKKIEDFREFHRQEFMQVQDTVKPNVKIYDFDHYFDFVVSICDGLAKTLGVE